MSRRRWRTKEARKLAEQITAAGGTVEFTANGHLMVTGPAGTATIPSSYGDLKSPAVTRAVLKREAGIELPRVGNAGPRGAGYHRRAFDPPRLARQEGILTRWRDSEDYGFITGDDGETYFLSRYQLNTYQLGRLAEGIRVSFSGDSEVFPGGRYPYARALRVAGSAA
jgi:cold shock CspA family protein